MQSEEHKDNLPLDGKKLNFMSELDLYTFFGNALDNAIESVSKLSEDKRAISLTMTKKGNFISLVIQNYTDNKIVPIRIIKEIHLLKRTKKIHFSRLWNEVYGKYSREIWW